MGVFLVITAFIVAVPVVSELLEGRRHPREWLSPALLSAGLFTSGSAFWFLSPEAQSSFGTAGVLIALAGLLLRGGADYSPMAGQANSAGPDALGQGGAPSASIP
jgi:hypothetical protein